MNRRSFIQSILAIGAAPAIITTPGVLMPVRRILSLDEVVPTWIRAVFSGGNVEFYQRKSVLDPWERTSGNYFSTPNAHDVAIRKNFEISVKMHGNFLHSAAIAKGNVIHSVFSPTVPLACFASDKPSELPDSYTPILSNMYSDMGYEFGMENGKPKLTIR